MIPTMLRKYAIAGDVTLTSLFEFILGFSLLFFRANGAFSAFYAIAIILVVDGFVRFFLAMNDYLFRSAIIVSLAITRDVLIAVLKLSLEKSRLLCGRLSRAFEKRMKERAKMAEKRKRLEKYLEWEMNVYPMWE
ncbi:MAG: hypothetical protein V1731_00175, partial [Candidatus Aenigmatarchaeota archaeon]